MNLEVSMFGSSIIDIAIGMVFIYLLLSLICSAANEIIERYSRRRARDLENGLKEMLLNVDGTGDLVKRLYEHPLVYSLFAKPYSPAAKTLPSYIPARNFALALMDLVGEGGAQRRGGRLLSRGLSAGRVEDPHDQRGHLHGEPSGPVMDLAPDEPAADAARIIL
jgi:hypothetical protein